MAGVRGFGLVAQADCPRMTGGECPDGLAPLCQVAAWLQRQQAKWLREAAYRRSYGQWAEAARADALADFAEQALAACRSAAQEFAAKRVGDG